MFVPENAERSHTSKIEYKSLSCELSQINVAILFIQPFFFLLLLFLFHLFDYAIGSYLTAKEELEQQNTMLRKEGSLEVKKAE